MNDRLAVWRRHHNPSLLLEIVLLAKVNDRLAVWRQFHRKTQKTPAQPCCKSERPLSGLETQPIEPQPAYFLACCKSERPLSGLETLPSQHSSYPSLLLAKVNDRLAVWRHSCQPSERDQDDPLAKVNDRLAVWRQQGHSRQGGQTGLAKVNDRLAVWRQCFYQHCASIFLKLAKVNDRLAVWRHLLMIMLPYMPYTCKSE